VPFVFDLGIYIDADLSMRTVASLLSISFTAMTHPSSGITYSHFSNADGLIATFSARYMAIVYWLALQHI